METLIYWTGAIVLLVGGWAVIAVLGYIALEYTLKTLGVTKLLLGWYGDKIRGKVLAKKADVQGTSWGGLG